MIQFYNEHGGRLLRGVETNDTKYSGSNFDSDGSVIHALLVLPGRIRCPVILEAHTKQNEQIGSWIGPFHPSRYNSAPTTTAFRAFSCVIGASARIHLGDTCLSLDGMYNHSQQLWQTIPRRFEFERGEYFGFVLHAFSVVLRKVIECW